MVTTLRQLIKPLLRPVIKPLALAHAALPPRWHWQGVLPCLLAWVGVSLVLLPLLPGLLQVFYPTVAWEPWQDLWADSQFPAALQATVVSALGSSVLALLLACWLAMLFYPGRSWGILRRQLPVLLAFPHAAFAIGLGFLLAPSGWLARGLAGVLDWAAPPQWVTVQDPYALSLTLALALKESGFLLWVLASLLSEQLISRQITLAHSLGYNRRQIWWQVLLPQLLPRLGWPLLAVLAYSLSVVDMALILGPSTPPTLAVLGWQWFSDPQLERQHQGSAVALLLVALLLGGILLGRLAFSVLRYWVANPAGIRQPGGRVLFGQTLGWLTFWPGWLALLMLVVWSFADRWFFPAVWPQAWGVSAWQQADFAPLWTSLWLAGVTVLIALPLTLLWLEWGGRGKWQGWLYLPLVLPALPLAAAQYNVLLHLYLDGTAIGVIWSHLTWVLPYMILVLAGAYANFDARYLLTAQALGYSHWQGCWRVKWPMLMRPILAALAVGFAVSIAQYLPTLFAGGGRIETVTTEAVALSAGGNRRVLAVQALLQALLPMLAFALATLLTYVYARQRKGLQ